MFDKLPSAVVPKTGQPLVLSTWPFSDQIMFMLLFWVFAQIYTINWFESAEGIITCVDRAIEW